MATRGERKSRTRRALADAAVSLFAERGYDAVTVDDVAAEVGVSRRTAFRYFPTKGDLVMEFPAEWWVVFERALAEKEASAIPARLRHASYAVAAHIEADPAGVRQLFALAFAHPALTARYAASTQEWVARIAREIASDLGPDPRSILRANVLAAAFMGMINSVCELWATHAEPMRPLLDVGFDLLAPAFEAVAGPAGGARNRT